MKQEKDFLRKQNDRGREVQRKGEREIERERGRERERERERTVR
jgi:hypothetical protein